MRSRLFALLLIIAVGLIAGYTVAKFIHAAPASPPGAVIVVNIQLAALVALVWSLATLATGLWLLRGWIARQWSWFTARVELALEGLFDFDTLNVGDGMISGSVSSASSISESARRARLTKLYSQRFGPGSTSTLRQEMDAIYRTPDGHLDWRAANMAILEYMERRLAEVPVGVLPQPDTPEYEACAQGALDDAAKTTCTACGKQGHWSPDCPDSGASSLSESARGLHLTKLYKQRFGDGSLSELRQKMDAQHRHADGSLNWQASNAAIIKQMECRLAGWHSLLPCRGCSWCGKDPGDLPDGEWTECDGSGLVFPTREQRERVNVRMRRSLPHSEQNLEAKGARLKREADAWSPENSTSWPFGQCGPPSTSSSNDC